MGGADDARNLQQQRQQNQRQSVLATTDNGHAGPTGWTTDFTTAGGLLGLRRMIESANPTEVQRVADEWKAIHDVLQGAQQAFESVTLAATDHWQGAAADAFSTRADELYQSLGNGASYAFNASGGVSYAADSLRTAQQDMPSVPSTADSAARALTSETNADQFNKDLASGMNRASALKLDGGQLSLTEERHQQAIVVMQTLEGQYASAAQMIGKAPADPVLTNVKVFPPPPTTHTPVDPPSGGTVSSPRSESVAGGAASGSKPSRYAGSPADPKAGTGRTGTTGSGEPVVGGVRTIQPKDPVTSVDGVTGGVATPPRQRSGSGGAGEPLSSSGSRLSIGGGSSSSYGSGGFSFSEAGMSGLGGSRSGQSVAGEPGASGIGEVADPVGEGLPGENAAGSGAVGEAESKAVSSGMPSFGGLGGKGKRRRARRRYSVEEEWEQIGEEYAGGEGVNEWLSARPEGGEIGLTRGGSGLLRSSGAEGRSGEDELAAFGGLDGIAARRRAQEKKRQRPDYLVEDEETWESGQDPIPPVIG